MRKLTFSLNGLFLSFFLANLWAQDEVNCPIGDGLILDFNVLCCGEQVLIDNDFANTSFDAANYQLLWALTAGSSTVASAADVAAALQIITPGADGHSFMFTNTCTGGVSDLASGLYSFTPFIANSAGQIDDRCEAYGGTVELYVLSDIVVSNVVLVCLVGGGYRVTFDVSGGAPGIIAGATYVVTDGGATSATDNGGGNYTVTYLAGVDYLITIENSVNGQSQNGCPVTLEGLEITLPEANDWQLSLCEVVEGGSQGSFDLTSAEANILVSGSGVVTGWYEDAGLAISITTPTAFVNTTNPQLVYAEVTDPVTNCTIVAQVTLTVNSLPVVDITAGGCGHLAPVVLDAGSGPGWSYNWQAGGETTQTINATEGYYEVTVTDDNGCENSSHTEVHNPISIIVHPQGCGDNDSLSITIEGGQPDHPGTAVLGTSYTMTSYEVSSSIDGVLGSADASGGFNTGGLSPGTHIITVSYEHLNEDGSEAEVLCSETVTVTIIEPLQLLTEYFCDEGIEATGGTPPYTYTLYESDSIAIIGTTSSGVFPYIVGTYYLEVTDAIGCSTSSEIECLTNFVCDLEVTHNPVCIDGLSYEVGLDLTGSGTYTIDDGVNPVLAGQGADTLTVGPLPNGPYFITITSETDTTCTTTVAGEMDCFECGIYMEVVSYCGYDFESFDAIITLYIPEGSGLYEVTSSSGLSFVTDGQSINAFVDGPFPVGMGVTYWLTSLEDSTCIREVTAIETQCYHCHGKLFGVHVYSDCENPVCSDQCCYPIYAYFDMYDDSSEYELINLLTGTTFIASEGEVLLGTICADEEGFLYDDPLLAFEESRCWAMLQETDFCPPPPPPCELEMDANFVCEDDDHFTAELSFTDPGDYTILVNGLSHHSGNITSLNIPGIASGPYQILAYSTNNTACQEFLEGVFECSWGQPCDLNVTATPICDEQGQVSWEVQIEGGSSYTLWFNSAVIAGFELPAGLYTIGEPVSEILVVDESSPDECTTRIETSFQCPQGSCDFNVHLDFECKGDSIRYSIVIDGDGLFHIESWAGEIHDSMGVYDGQYELSLPQGEYFISVGADLSEYGLNGSFCNRSYSGEIFCPQPSCDFLLFTEPYCDPNEEKFFVEVQIIGPDIYQISFGDSTMTDLIEGIYTVGPFTGSPYTLIAENMKDPTCKKSVNASFCCEFLKPPCLLKVTVEPFCRNQETFVAVEIVGDGTYRVDNFLEPLFTLTSGYYEFGPYPGAFYRTVIEDVMNERCRFKKEGEFECVPEKECEFDAEIIGVFYADSVLIEIEGNSLYTIQYGSDNVPLLAGVPAGIYLVPLVKDQWGNTLTIVSDDLNPRCSMSFSEMMFGPDAECLADFKTDVVCGENGAYFIELEVTQPLVPEICLSIFDRYMAGVGLAQDECFFDMQQGSYLLGPYISTLQPTVSSGCIRKSLAHWNNCINPCQTLIITEEIMQPDGSFQLEVSIEGDDHYVLHYEDDFGLAYTKKLLLEGTYNFNHSSYANSYTLTIQDMTTTCYTKIEKCVNCGACQECDLKASIKECAGEFNKGDEIYISGSGDYVVDFGVGDPIFVTEEDSPILSYDVSSTRAIRISDLDKPDCYLELLSVADCGSPGTCVDISTLQAFCIDSDEYEVILDLQGSPPFTVISGGAVLLSADTTGLHTIGPLEGGNNIIIESTLWPQGAKCSQSISVENPCSDYQNTCNLYSEIETECLPNGSYNLIAEITGSDVYSLALLDTIVENIEAGTYHFGPFYSQNYQVEIIAERSGTYCRTLIEGEADCLSGMPCNLQLDVKTICDNNDVVGLELYTLGSGPWQIFDNEGLLFEGNGSETHYLEYAGVQRTTLLVKSLANADCFQEITMTPYCESVDILSNNFINFSGEKTESGNLLQWQTAQEELIDHFILKRTFDGVGFEQIAKLNAKSVNNPAHTYEFLDRSFAEVAYYQLTSVDLMGVNKIHPKIIRLEGNSPALLVHPNPFTNFIQIETDDEEPKKLKVFGSNGQLVHSGSMKSSQTLGTSNWPVGTYFIRIENEDDRMFVEKLIKQ